MWQTSWFQSDSFVPYFLSQGSMAMHKNIYILPWAPKRRHFNSLGLMTMWYCEQKRKVGVRGSCLSYFGDEPTLHTSGSCTTWMLTPEVNRDRKGRAVTLSGSLKKEKRKSSQPDFFLFFSAVNLEISLAFP